MKKIRKISTKSRKKLKVLLNIEKGMKEIAMFRKGKLNLNTLDQLLNEI